MGLRLWGRKEAGTATSRGKCEIGQSYPPCQYTGLGVTGTPLVNGQGVKRNPFRHTLTILRENWATLGVWTQEKSAFQEASSWSTTVWWGGAVVGKSGLSEGQQSANGKPPRWQEGRVHQFRFTVEFDGPEPEQAGSQSLGASVCPPQL